MSNLKRRSGYKTLRSYSWLLYTINPPTVTIVKDHHTYPSSLFRPTWLTRLRRRTTPDSSDPQDTSFRVHNPLSLEQRNENTSILLLDLIVVLLVETFVPEFRHLWDYNLTSVPKSNRRLHFYQDHNKGQKLENPKITKKKKGRRM